MTVAELIEKLSGYDPDKLVFVPNDYSNWDEDIRVQGMDKISVYECGVQRDIHNVVVID